MKEGVSEWDGIQLTQVTEYPKDTPALTLSGRLAFPDQHVKSAIYKIPKERCLGIIM